MPHRGRESEGVPQILLLPPSWPGRGSGGWSNELRSTQLMGPETGSDIETADTRRGPEWQMLAAHGAIALVAAAMRLWDLGSRAMHHDESLHAYYAWNIYAGNGYQHNPMMHGPLQMEATAALFLPFGDSDYTARLLYAIAGTALVVLPYFFRSRLGNLGAIFVSVLLAFSPAMLYFSRFARNDILMAVWTLGLVVCMWRYIDEGKPRYLYIGAALLALVFATKETAYIVTSTLGLYLVLVVAVRNWPAIREGIAIGEVSPPVAAVRIVGGAWSVFTRGLTLRGISRPAAFLVLLITLTLPLWAALVSVLQDTPLLSWSGLVLASPGGSIGPIGAPIRGGLVIAALVVLTLVWISAVIGFKWSRSVWWRSVAIFYSIFFLVYTTFLNLFGAGSGAWHWENLFTNMVGIGSGMWQSLGYWLVQQGEGRGGQPWYYYVVITSVYEFLPLLIAIVGAVYYIRRRDTFGLFLVFWAAVTFILYSFASEKMPWLLVNVTLPLIVLSGKFLGDVAVDLRSRLVGIRRLTAIAAFGLVAVMLALTIRTGWTASYQNGDTPVEMLVYTQTSPDIVGLLRHVEQAGDALEDPTAVPISIDGTSGFTWPWAWYLRRYTKVAYPSYDGGLQDAPDSSVLLVHANNRPQADELPPDQYTEGVRIKHRWWFPEVYKGVTVRQLLGAIVDPSAWRTAIDYFLFRELGTPLGSEDAYVYFSPEFPPGFSPLE